MKYNIYTIAPHLPFADTLAQWLLDTMGTGPLGLARAHVLLPSRRACLSLREAFLRQAKGKALLLPRLQPLGDIEDDAVAAFAAASADGVAPGFAFRRLFILARLVEGYRTQMTGEPQRMEQALMLARDLAHLLDECERERVPLERLRALVPDAFACHWQLTIDFLKILSEHWPAIAKEQGLASPETLRAQRFEALRRQWRETPPDYPVIAAGTTGSIPATAELLKAICDLPQGALVLPGFEALQNQGKVAALGQCHPQWGMHALLDTLGYAQEDVLAIGAGAASERARLMREVMRPAAATAAWQGLSLDKEKALAGLARVTCAHAQEEATCVALMLREALETPHKTAALVTHDRALAARVAAILHRFAVTIDDSAGIPLGQTPAAIFLRLILAALENEADPVALLALLKHPLCRAGMERIAALEAARALELLALRGRNGHAPQDVLTLLDNLARMLQPLRALFESGSVTLAALAEAHLQCGEALSGGEVGNSPESAALYAFMEEMGDSSGDAGPIGAKRYPAIFDALIRSQTFRRPYGMHPRLKILSPREARMQTFDRIVLGGLNEGSWPPDAGNDPWFSRAMREALGLPPLERRVGLAAHDFATLACAPEVFLTRSRKTDGAPATASRWWVKLGVLLAKLGAQEACEDTRWVAWARALDLPKRVTPALRPAPKPPLHARPRRLSVTQIEIWQRDPYSIYAAHILRLRPLEPLGSEPGNADFGIAVHAALERFVKAYPEALPGDAYERLLAYGREAFAPILTSAALKALWWPRFERIAAWVMVLEAERRQAGARVLPESEGTLAIGNFLLTGRADRIEQYADGRLAIVDYKTGTPPAAREMEAGLASQLTLLGLIFAPAGKTPMLEYWHLRGGREAGEVQPVNEKRVADTMQAAKEGLRRLVETYDNPQFPYFATPVASRGRRYNDYAHLARVKEWE